jgi:hypothetical protein
MIIRSLWAFFLFGLWVIFSQSIGLNGQWWSMYRLNPEKYSHRALEFSYYKILIFASLSVISAYFISKWTGGIKNIGVRGSTGTYLMLQFSK